MRNRRWLLLHFGVGSIALSAVLVGAEAPGWASLLAVFVGAFLLASYDSMVPK